ncbi:hypothetical protein MN116_007720 [Schistosoma mekongi]|uniref:Rho-GAP domain-containing protein n=1 Tax=Schistosoma mekongi TaxID=38744 RepID=A0AAE2D296_SCHME|nr:hypothetical protein MN116_007720 [Schistosoma mekongi]
MFHNQMLNACEDNTGISKRSRIFRGRGVQHRSDVKKKARRNQSTGDLMQNSTNEQMNSISMKNDNTSNTSKKIPKWLRLLKMTSISATTAITPLDTLKTENNHNQQINHHHQQQQHQYYPDNTVSVSSSTQETKSFLGNLGIGAYVGDEENAFVTSEISEDIHSNQVNKPLSKSMINLSSVSLWSPKRKTSDQINESQALLNNNIIEHNSCLSSLSRISCISNPSSSSSPSSTSSYLHLQKKRSIYERTNTITSPTFENVTNQLSQSELYESMPLILRTVINPTSFFHYITTTNNNNNNNNNNSNTSNSNNMYSLQNYHLNEGYTPSNLTPKLSTNTITGINSNCQSGDNITVKRTIIHYPAWMIINDEQLQLDTTYSFYRISDYLKELYTAESWLENLLSSDILQSRSHSPLRQPTDYRSRRARTENNTINSNKMLKRTCSEQRYDENQLIGGLWDRREMDLVQKLIRRAISIIELKMSSRQVDNGESYSAMSAILFRNSSSERKFPISLRSFIPDCEKVTDNNNNNNSEITSWKKIYAEEIVNVVKLPRYPIEQHLNLETIHQSQKSTIFLCSDYLVLTQWPLDSQSFVCAGDLAHIIPLCEVWCDIVKLDELFMRSSGPSKSANHKYSPNEKSVKHSEVDNDHLKCNISSSSGISTASLEDGDLKSPSIDHYSQTVDAELMKTPGLCSSNDNHLSSSDNGQFLLIGRPLMENWAIQFPNNDLCVKWKQMINESIRRNQQLFDGKSINVKVINQIIPNHQVVYKYHNIPIHMTVDHLKEKALDGLNINVSHSSAELYLRYTESNGDEREILLYGPEYPFLIALYSVHMNNTTSASNTSNTSTTNSNINLTSRNNSPDDNNHNKDILDFIRKSVVSPSQSEMKTTDHDWIISRDQIKVSFVLRPVDKCSTDNNQQQHPHYQNQHISKSEMIKSTEYTKQERGRSTSKVRGRRSETRNNMTKSTLFLDSSSSSNNNNNNSNNNNATKYTTNVPLRAAISTSSLQFGTTQEIKCGQIFGRLPEQCWPDCRLPESLVNLFAIIYYNGVNVEGIFRRTAVHSQIELMRARVDENIQSITPNNCNPILASCVLKRFFCEIPGHLLIDSNWDEWARLTEINSATERLQVIERLIRSLPKVNQTLLALLIYLLAHIRDHEDINRMSARNLAVVWGPNLIQRSNSPLALIDSKIATQIVTYLLEPSVTNFLLNNTSNVKNELNQHFSNIWGNFLKNSKNSITTTSTNSNLINISNIPVIISNSIIDSSEDDKSPKHDSHIVHSEYTNTDVKLKHTTRRGYSVSNIPPQINPLEVDNLLNTEKCVHSLLKTSDQLPESSSVANVSSSNLSLDNKCNHHLISDNPSHTSLMKRRGVGRINKKKHNFFNQPALPDQTGPPLLSKSISGPTEAITTELRNIIRSRTTSTILLPLSLTVAATTTTTPTAAGAQEVTVNTSPSSRRSRNTSCPPSSTKTTFHKKSSIPYPLPRSHLNSESPPIPLRGQQSIIHQTCQDIPLKHLNDNNHRLRNNSNGNMPRSESDMSMVSTDSSLLSYSSTSSTSSSLRKTHHNKTKNTGSISGIPCPIIHRPEFDTRDIGYATSYHENLENIIESNSKVYNNNNNNNNNSNSGTPLSRMSSHASTISSESTTVISTSTEK